MVYTLASGEQMTRRKRVVVTGAASGAQMSFQIKMDAIAHAAAMQSDFDDLRFAKADMQTLIDAWLEDKTDDTSADIWAEFPTTPANAETEDYWMYYGNAGVGSDWDIGATFLFGDDFIGVNGDAPDSGKWAKRNTPTIQGNTLQNVDDEFVVSQNAYDIRGKYLETKFKITTDAKQNIMIGDTKTVATTTPYDASGQDGYGIQRYDTILKIRPIVNGVMGNIAEESSYFSGFSGSNWHRFAFQVNGASPYSSLFRVHKTSWYDYHTENWHDTNFNMYIYLGVRGTSSSVTSEYDWVFLRKYAANPATYAFGTEEHQRRTPQFM